MKKAKFVVEIEYDEGAKTNEDVNVKECTIEGDYEGLMMAMVSGLVFGRHKGHTDFETFKKKLAVLRATGSALATGFSTLVKAGVVDADKEEELMVHKSTAGIINIVTKGLGQLIGLTPEQFKEAESDYKHKNEEDGTEQERGEDDISDFI